MTDAARSLPVDTYVVQTKVERGGTPLPDPDCPEKRKDLLGRTEQHGIDLPRLRDLAPHALPRLVESTLIPLGLFYLFLHVVGTWGAIIAGVAWCYASILRRLIQGEKMPGMLVITALGVTIRLGVALVSGSVFVYFLQGNLSAIALAGAFLLSALAGKPLVERLAQDLCPLPATFVAHPTVKRAFARLTLLWASIHLVSAILTIWLLMSTPIAVYVAVKTPISMTLTWVGAAISILWFRRTTKGQFARAWVAQTAELSRGESPRSSGVAGAVR
jgi:hypothetical protein